MAKPRQPPPATYSDATYAPPPQINTGAPPGGDSRYLQSTTNMSNDSGSMAATGTHRQKEASLGTMLLTGRGPTESNFEATPYDVQLGDYSATTEGMSAGRNAYELQTNIANRRIGDAMQAQSGYLDQVQQGTAGRSLAEAQLQSGMDQANRGAMAAAITGRGGPGAMMNAQRMQQQNALGINQQTAELRAQEQATARDAYSQSLGLQQGMAAQGADTALGYDQARLAQLAQEQSFDLGGQSLSADAYNEAMSANQAMAEANLNATVTQRENKKDRRDKWMQKIGGALVGGM